MSSARIFAHRGASLEAAENTRTAFLKALAYPIDGIETDIQLTRDGVPVLWHDDDLTKIGLPERAIKDFSATELAHMEFGVWFDARQAGEPILSLSGLLSEFAHQRMWLLEIKQFTQESPHQQRLKVRRSLEVALPYKNAGADIFFSSFHLDSLVYAHHLTTAFPYVFNSEGITTANQVDRLWDDCPYLAGLCLPIEPLSEELVAAVHARSKLAAVYSCNSAAEIRMALECGVDFLISDRPALALALRAALGFNRKRVSQVFGGT